MFISKKRYASLCKRIDDLESSSNANTWTYGKTSLQQLARIVEAIGKPPVAADGSRVKSSSENQ